MNNCFHISVAILHSQVCNKTCFSLFAKFSIFFLFPSRYIYITMFALVNLIHGCYYHFWHFFTYAYMHIIMLSYHSSSLQTLTLSLLQFDRMYAIDTLCCAIRTVNSSSSTSSCSDYSYYSCKQIYIYTNEQ